jgi:hypothetical protein
MVLLALEVEVHVALPREADAAVELDGAVGAERGRVRRGGLRHAREAERVLRVVVDRAGRGVRERARAVDGDIMLTIGCFTAWKKPIGGRTGADARVLRRRLELPLGGAAEVGGDDGEDRGERVVERGRALPRARDDRPRATVTPSSSSVAWSRVRSTMRSGGS